MVTIITFLFSRLKRGRQKHPPLFMPHSLIWQAYNARYGTGWSGPFRSHSRAAAFRQAFQDRALGCVLPSQGLRQSRHRSGHAERRKTFANEGGIFLVDTLTGCGPTSCSGSPCKSSDRVKRLLPYWLGCGKLGRDACRSSARIASSKSSAKRYKAFNKVFRNVRHFLSPS